MMRMLEEILQAGINALTGYLSEHVLTCLIPAFFIAGAIAVFVSKESILKYFGAGTKKYISYSVASVSGAILAVCSCTILPLFASIYKRGAGIGPAITFLYSGPAVNILAILLTARVLGFDIGIARAVASVGMSVVIGIIMATIFKKHDEEVRENKNFVYEKNKDKNQRRVSLAVFTLLILLLIFATSPFPWNVKFSAIYVLTILIAILLIFYYSREEVKEWGNETWFLFKRLFPVLLAGVFLVGVVGGIASQFVDAKPDKAVGVAIKDYMGGNNLRSCFIASIIGAVLYMPTLLEVPIVNDLFGYNSGIMGAGPALSLLLAGPSLSLPNMIVITKVTGGKKSLTYIVLVVIFSTIVGYIYGVVL
ncbi:MAG TPA: permease [Thermoplasmatales archaeon]|nr:permease [Thermoplasmatales archaeon]